MNPEPTEFTLPPLRRDYLGHADILLLHRLGGDPSTQETICIWDSGVRLKPTGQAVYLGLMATEVLIQRMRFFSYWSAKPASVTSLDQLTGEISDLHIKSTGDSMMIIRDVQIPESVAVHQAVLVTVPADR